VAMGNALRALRNAAGLSRPAVARVAQCHPHSLARIERADRRTRRSTLERIVAAIVPEDRVAETVDRLVEIVGPALAMESPWAHRIDRRRRRRVRLRANREAMAAELVPEVAEQLVRQLHVRKIRERRWGR